MMSKASKIQELLVSHAVLIPPVLTQSFLDFAKLLRFGQGDYNVAALEEFATQKWLMLRQTLETRAVWLDQQIENGVNDVADGDETDALIESYLRTITLMTSNEPIECKIVEMEGFMEDEECEEGVELDDDVKVLIFRSVTAEIVEIHSRFGTLTEHIVNSAFYSTCCDGNIAVARLYLALGASPHWQCPVRRNLLAHVSNSGKYDIVKFLLSVDIDLQLSQPFDPLMFACDKGHIEIVRLLLSDRRISEWLTTHREPIDNEILTVAIRGGQHDIVRMLLADIPWFCPFRNDRSRHAIFRGCDFDSALLTAAQSSQTDIVKTILEYGITRTFENRTDALDYVKVCTDEVTYIVQFTILTTEIRGLLNTALHDFASIKAKLT